MTAITVAAVAVMVLFALVILWLPLGGHYVGGERE